MDRDVPVVLGFSTSSKYLRKLTGERNVPTSPCYVESPF